MAQAGPGIADNGDVKGVFFRYEQVQDGKLVVRKIG